MERYKKYLNALLLKVIPEAKSIELIDVATDVAHTGSSAVSFARAVLEKQTLKLCWAINETWIRTLPYVLVDALVAAYGRDFAARLNHEQRLDLVVAQQRTPLRPLFWDAYHDILDEEHPEPAQPAIVCAGALALGEPVPKNRLDPFVFVFDAKRPIYNARLWVEVADDAFVPTDAVEALERDVAYWTTRAQ